MFFGENACQRQTNAFQNTFHSDTENKGPAGREAKNLDSLKKTNQGQNNMKRMVNNVDRTGSNTNA